jgi:tetratricopeptide (TPR) repeat protein
MYIIDFDETWHLVNLTWHHLSEERYQEALAACHQIITRQDDPPSHAYLGAARAWAGLGDRDQAFEHLNTAVARGWSNLANTQSYREFQTYHGTPEWESALERIRHNAHCQRAG